MACLIKLLRAIPWKEFYMYNELGELEKSWEILVARIGCNWLYLTKY